MPNNENKVYLTFDDGPTPEITTWVLEILKKNQIEATFFCIGKNANENPEIMNSLLQNGHSIGNHTFNHPNGWQISLENYLENVKKCESVFEKFPIKNSKLFRPPYGKLTEKQSNFLRLLGYKIIMWDVLSADFDTTISPEKCLENVLKNVKSGSIIIFHDSIKASKNMQYALPIVIQKLKEKGFQFEKLG